VNRVSRAVPYTAGIAGAVTIALLALFITQSHAIFSALPPSGAYSTLLWIQVSAPSKQAAILGRDAARTHALVFLAKRDFFGDDVDAKAPQEVTLDVNSHRWQADQQIAVSCADYSKLARMNNAVVPELDPSKKLITGSFPSGVFIPICIAIALGCLLVLVAAVAALETREADISRAPRGMHPIFIGIQTALYGALAALAVVYANVLAAPAKPPFVIVSVVGIGLLGTWLWRTRPWWTTPSLRFVWFTYVAAFVAVIATFVWALETPLT
jgi:hypothetical protein